MWIATNLQRLATIFMEFIQQVTTESGIKFQALLENIAG